MGSVRIAANPASTRKIESTAAKMGRSMKKRENMAEYLFCGLRGRGLCGGLGDTLFALRRLALGRPSGQAAFGDCLRNFYRRSRTSFDHAVDYDPIAAFQ